MWPRVEGGKCFILSLASFGIAEQGVEARKAQPTGLPVNQALKDSTRWSETAERRQPSVRPESSRCWDRVV